MRISLAAFSWSLIICFVWIFVSQEQEEEEDGRSTWKEFVSVIGAWLATWWIVVIRTRTTPSLPLPPPPPSQEQQEEEKAAIQEEVVNVTINKDKKDIEPITKDNNPSDTKKQSAAEQRVRSKLSEHQLALCETLLKKLGSDDSFRPDHISMSLSLVNAYRYLKARTWKMHDAEMLWRGAVEWRTTFRMSERRARLDDCDATPLWDLHHDYFKKHWMHWLTGPDARNVPVVVLRAGTADPAGMCREAAKGDTTPFAERHLAVVERAIELMYEAEEEDRGYVEIDDMREFPEVPHYFSRAYASLGGFYTVARILDNHYPERVRRVHIVGAPRVFNAIWRLVQHLVPPETRKKLFFYSAGKEGEWLPRIAEDVPLERLPQYLGGQGPNTNVLLGGAATSFAQFVEMNKPLFSMGLIADVQHMDAPDGQNFARTTTRYYRGALKGLERAVDDFVARGVSHIVQLGDLVDGGANSSTINDTEGAFRRALAVFSDKLSSSKNMNNNNVGVTHIIGNHELYNAKMRGSTLNTLFGGIEMNGPRVVTLPHHPRFKFLVLDAYEISVITHDETTPEFREADVILTNENPNNPWRSSVDWLAGLTGVRRRFAAYNGAVSTKQLAWLETELKGAVEAGQFVMVFSHVPLGPGSCSSSCLLWNYPDVLETLSRYATSVHWGKAGVLAVFAGHAHAGGYALDSAGIHHVTVASPLEIPSCTAHGILLVFESELILQGRGRVPSRRMPVFDSKESARRAFETYTSNEISNLFAAVVNSRLGKTRDECEQAFWNAGGSWDALGEGWPKKSLPGGSLDVE